MKKFSSDFIFGAATAAYQAEGFVDSGNKIPNCWDEFYNRPDAKFNAKTASEFYKKYPEDIAIAKKIGVNGLRISLSWSRIMDQNNNVNQEGIIYYKKLIKECHLNGIEPFVTLHHFDTPLYLFKNGDWLNRETIKKFKKFAKICFSEFTTVKNWITINEPYSVVAGNYIIGHFPTGIQYDMLKAIKALHNMNVAHAEVLKLFKGNNYNGKIGVVHILEGKYPITNTPQNIEVAKNWDAFCNGIPLEETFKGELSPEVKNSINKILKTYNANWDDDILEKNDIELLKSMKNSTDFIGINYYASHHVKYWDGESLIKHNASGTKGSSIFRLKGLGEMVNNENIPKTDWDWPIFPKGLYDMIMKIHEKYKVKEIYVTENGYGDKDVLENGTVNDDKRINYIKLHLNAILDAIKHGANVKGYFLWSLMDLFSWTNGYSKRYGFVYVDFKTQNRFIKKSGYWWKELSSKKELKEVKNEL